MSTLQAEGILNGIQHLMQNYFDGLYEADPEKLARVFHPAAHYTTASQGEFVHLTLDEYLQRVSMRASLVGTGFQRTDQVHTIEHFGADTAFVRATCSLPGRFFTDLLSVVRVGGRWQIIAKVFHWEPVSDS